MTGIMFLAIAPNGREAGGARHPDALEPDASLNILKNVKQMKSVICVDCMYLLLICILPLSVYSGPKLAPGLGPPWGSLGPYVWVPGHRGPRGPGGQRPGARGGSLPQGGAQGPPGARVLGLGPGSWARALAQGLGARAPSSPSRLS